MVSKALKRFISKEDSTLSLVADNFFCPQPIDHILSGFYIDKAHYRIYFGQIYLPLCDHLLFPHLGFGRRFDGEFGTIKIGSKDRDVARSFVEAIRPYRELAGELADLESFIAYAPHHVSLGNSLIRRGYANALILAGKYVDAEEHLEMTMSTKASYIRTDWDREFVADTSTVLTALRRDPLEARELLLSWEAETKQRFGIPP